MSFNIQTHKSLSSENVKRIIALGLSLKDVVTGLEQKCIEEYDETKTYLKDAYVTHDNYLWKAKTVSTGEFDESKWIKIGDDLSLITIDDIKSMINLTDEEIANLQSLILDSSIELSHVWSSSKVYSEIQNAIQKGEAFTLSKLASTMTASFEIASSTSDMTANNILYLLSTGTNMYDIYALIDGTPTPIASTTIDLTAYAKLTDLDNYYDKATTDGKYATITTVDGKIDKTSILSTISSSPSDDNLLSEKAINDTLVKKTDITTTIDSTSTDSELPTAKSVYVNSLTKGMGEGNTVIPDGSDLNDYLTPGVYTCFSSATGETLLNCPHKASNFKLFVNKNTGETTGFYGYQMIVGSEFSTMLKPCVYYRSIGGDKTNLTYSKWQKLCSTSVADVPRTKITSESENVAGQIYYTIKNGICFVYLRNIELKKVEQGSIVCSNMPTSSMFVNSSLIKANNGGEQCGFAYIEENTNILYVHSYEVFHDGYCSFSYPVAE